MALLDYTYPELSDYALNTPVEDWRTIFHYMRSKKLKTLFDAGAGNALSAQVAQNEFRDLFVYAWEIVEERIKDILCPDHDVRVADLFTEDLPKSDVIFLYLPTGPLLERILDQLSPKQKVIAVESHGELFKRLEENSLLIEQLPQIAKRHAPFIHIYEWCGRKHNCIQDLRSKSYRNDFEQIQIKEEDPFLGESLWLADCYGLTVTSEKIVETMFPPRRFPLSYIQGFATLKNKQILLERREGKWRKLFIHPRLVIENNIGQRIEVDESRLIVEKD